MFRQALLLAINLWIFFAPALIHADEADNLAASLAERREKLAQYRQRQRYTQSLVRQLVQWHLKHPELVRKELERRQSAKEPIGDDPFGDPADDPFGDAAFVPFAEGSDPFAEEGKRRFEQIVADWPLSRVPRTEHLLFQIHVLDQYRQVANVDADFLERQLAFAHAAVWLDPQRCGSLADIAAALAAHRWPRASGETTHAMLERLAKDSHTRGAGSHLASDAKQFYIYSVAPYPFAWRDAADRWLAWCAAVIDGGSAEDSAAFWQSQIDANRNDAVLYRAAYLGWVRAHRDQPFRAAIVRPWLDDEQVSAAEQSVRVIATLRTLAARGVGPDHTAQRRLRERLARLVVDPRWNTDADSRGVDQLALLAAASTAADNDEVLRCLAAASPEVLENYCDLLDIDRTTRAKLYENRPVEFAWSDKSAASVFERLASRVALPIWLDAAVRDDERPLPLHFAGRWADAFALAVKKAGYVAEKLPDGVIWVGPAAKAKDAGEFYAASKARSADEPALVRAVLDEPCELQVIETPRGEVCDQLADRHDFEFHALGDWKEQDSPITGNYRHLPVHLLLTLMCRENGLAWTAKIDCIAVGSPEQVAKFNAAAERHRAKQAWLAKLPKNSPLHGRSMIEFVETRVSDVLAYFSDLHGISVVFDWREAAALAEGDRVPDKFHYPVTIRALPETMAWGLTKALAAHPLDWWSDGEVIYVSTPEKLPEYKQLAERRTAARLKYPASVRDKLIAACNVGYETSGELSLSEFLAALPTESGVVIKLDEKLDTGAPHKLMGNNFTHAPLDKALDVICLELGLTWTIRADTGVLIQKK